jgi:hypothetical protein
MYLLLGAVTTVVGYTICHSIKWVFVSIGKIIRAIVRDELSKFNIK